MTTLAATIAQGPFKGETLTPHRHSDGQYVVSPDRYVRSYIRVKTIAEVITHMARGLSVRMSAPGARRSASLICPASITAI